MARGLVPSRPFPTCLRRPHLFRLAGKDGGEKGRWGTVGACCGCGSGKPLFSVAANTRSHPTGAMVRAACYGTTDLQIIAFELLR